MKKHNIKWFYNRIGTKIYCTDHEKKDKCEGILLEFKYTCENVIKNQDRGIRFYEK